MRFSVRSKLSILFSLLAIAAIVSSFAVSGAFRGNAMPAHAANSMHIDCSSGRPTCTEVYDSEAVFGKNAYVGHDEPSTLFYSNVPGSGNQMRYQLTLPKDPSPSLATTPGVALQLPVAPGLLVRHGDVRHAVVPRAGNRLHSPTAISTSSIQRSAPTIQERPSWRCSSIRRAGCHGLRADSCDPTKWCAALNIDSLSENPVTGQSNACVCQQRGASSLSTSRSSPRAERHSRAPAESRSMSTINTFTPNPSSRSVHELRRSARRHHARYGTWSADRDQRPDDRPERLDDEPAPLTASARCKFAPAGSRATTSRTTSIRCTAPRPRRRG